jgi:hypothetical protein
MPRNVARPAGGGFSPDGGGGRGGSTVAPIGPLPLKPGKNKGAGLGSWLAWFRSYSPVYLSGFQGVYKMYTSQKRYYSPQFSGPAAVSVRRLAWALGVSMPRAVDHVVELLPSLFSPGTVCLACKDSTKCQLCAFSKQAAAAPAAPAV